MILKISFKPEDVISQANGIVVLKLRYYTAFALAAYLITAEGNTAEEFNNAKIKSSKQLFVGVNGGISVDG
jgi:hypothetical protein